MYKNIVVGTDGSETASVAVAHAAALAKATGATLHIVHAYQPVSFSVAAMSASSGGPIIDLDRLNAGIADSANAICAQALRDAGTDGVAVESHSIAGDPGDALITVAKSVDADVLVVGNRGMQGKKRFMLGSVPNKISHHAPCSLLIVDTSR